MKPACHDCGLQYTDPRWDDFVVSDETWAKLTEADNARLLCVCCMISRAKAMRIEARGEFRSGQRLGEWVIRQYAEIAKAKT